MLGQLYRRFFGPKDQPAVRLSAFAQPLQSRFLPAPKKRILALDGGGIRGAMTVAVLERVEALLRARHNNDPDFRLCDYYDLIGGTSTGSIIAAALCAKRFSAAEIKDFYFELGPQVFRGNLLRQGFTRAKFDGSKLLKLLQDVFGDVTLGDPSLATGLAIVAKRVDTSSTWVIHNNPSAPYFESPGDGSYIGNRHYPLINVIRASTAAPHYFKPQKIEIIRGREHGLFVDGGITPHNNPAFQLLMLAGLENYGYNWDLNVDSLLVTSIGTGSMAQKYASHELNKQLQIAQTLKALTSMITSSEDFVELLMQWLGDSPDPRMIDSEVGTLHQDYLGLAPRFTYQRYQSVLTRQGLQEEFGVQLTDGEVKTLRDMTSPKALPISYEVGQAMAETLIREEHFPQQFDLAGA